MLLKIEQRAPAALTILKTFDFPEKAIKRGSAPLHEIGSVQVEMIDCKTAALSQRQEPAIGQSEKL
ncbi:hypothetical protein AA18890_3287 [Komagataeibacter europaeus LMG 18890]|nr:hypothetical protein AA18890_3287 [Komagataeibacter europaeus LMG 18890]